MAVEARAKGVRLCLPSDGRNARLWCAYVFLNVCMVRVFYIARALHPRSYGAWSHLAFTAVASRVCGARFVTVAGR